MKLGRFSKSPTERKRYTVDYSEWLETGETVASVTYTVVPVSAGSLTVDASSLSADLKSIIFFVNGGIDGVQYTVEPKIVTSGGQIKEDQIIFSIKDL